MDQSTSFRVNIKVNYIKKINIDKTIYYRIYKTFVVFLIT